MKLGAAALIRKWLCCWGWSPVRLLDCIPKADGFWRLIFFKRSEFRVFLLVAVLLLVLAVIFLVDNSCVDIWLHTSV